MCYAQQANADFQVSGGQTTAGKYSTWIHLLIYTFKYIYVIIKIRSLMSTCIDRYVLE